jgi:hypothetical protein
MTIVVHVDGTHRQTHLVPRHVSWCAGLCQRGGDTGVRPNGFARSPLR